MIRIVHLSDFHLDASSLIDVKTFMMNTLIKDLKKYNEIKSIDLIIFTGDLVDKGGFSFNNDIELAFLNFEEIVITPILNELNLKREQVFFAPGNHDINRNADEEIEELGLRAKLKSIEEINKHIDSGKAIGCRRVLDFKDFEKEFYGDSNIVSNITNYQSNFMLELDENVIGITCFNSSWRCYDSKTDKNQICLGERQVSNSRKFLKDSNFNIGIIHHPLDWFKDFENKTINSFMQSDYSLLLCGHVHEGSTYSATNMYGNLFVSVAPSNLTYNMRSSDRNYANGYSIIDLDTYKREITVHHRRYYHEKGVYDPNPDLGDKDGLSYYKLPDSEMLKKRNYEISIAEKLKNMYFNDFNEHLISYNTDTLAPKEIQKIFVLPKIKIDIKYKPEEGKEEKIYTVKDLCLEEDNIFLLGEKESGKTVLIDRLFMELADKISKYGVIPLLIDFEDFSQNRLETAISKFLGIGIMDVMERLEEHKFKLLIDNFNLSKSNSSKLKILEQFLIAHKSVKVIATINSEFETEIPFKLSMYPILQTFKSIKLDGFKTKNIRELAKKWFSNNKGYDTPDKLEKILKTITSLNIPRTPLAISMFLWIIEKQENYKPINNATMLENFIERLFRKWTKDEIYSEKFDYRNKERLLTTIAKEMFQKNNINYHLSYNDLRNFIYNYIKSRKFDFEAEEVLRHFIGKGILIKENDKVEPYVRFRFTCFFKYFLMKNMEHNSDFKDFVLHEDNFLFFIDEIDYYTGIKRDQVGILKLVIQRMNEEYKETVDKITDLKHGFDSFFETNNNVAATLDAKFVKRLPEEHKPTNDEKDEMSDTKLDLMTTEDGIEKKEEQISQMQKLDRLWALAATVLKNTEETDIEDMKSNSYKDILTCSMSFSCIYKFSLERLLRGDKKNEFNKTTYENYKLTCRFLPLIHETTLYSLIATGKLSIVFREKIEKDLKDSKISDYEKYISLFIYSDMKGEHSISLIKKFIKQIKRSYIYDRVLFKLVSYYFMRSDNDILDSEYEKLISEVMVNAKGLKKVDKGKIINDFHSRKLIRISSKDFVAAAVDENE